MPSLTEPISRIEFFAGIDRKLLTKVAESAIVCDYEKGEVIVREGEMGLGMYVILGGRVEVTKDKEGTAIRLAELGPEQFFAEMSLIDEKPRSATITTIEETKCLLFTRDSFVTLMGKNPQLAIRLARSLAERLRKTDDLSRAMPAPPSAAPPSAAAADAPAPKNGTAHSNGNEAESSAQGAKAAIQQRLLGMFEWLYTAKAFTRFSVAVLGCPVEGSAVNVLQEIRLGDVKALILPAGESVEMSIEAYGSGSFNLHVFTPEHPHAVRFDPVTIEPGDRFVLSLPDMSLSSSAGAPGGIA